MTHLKSATIPVKIGDKVHQVSCWTIIEEEYQCDSCDMHFHSKEQYEKHQKKEAGKKKMDEVMLKLFEEDNKWSDSINELFKGRDNNSLNK